VDYQGAGCGAALYGVDAGYGFGVERVRSQTVDGFGGKRYEASFSDNASGGFNFFG
jgi:hypothetical protein